MRIAADRWHESRRVAERTGASGSPVPHRGRGDTHMTGSNDSITSVAGVPASQARQPHGPSGHAQCFPLGTSAERPTRPYTAGGTDQRMLRSTTRSTRRAWRNSCEVLEPFRVKAKRAARSGGFGRTQRGIAGFERNAFEIVVNVTRLSGTTAPGAVERVVRKIVLKWYYLSKQQLTRVCLFDIPIIRLLSETFEY